MYQVADYRKRFAQVAVVALLAFSAVARAESCAGGVDATGNDCTGEQAERGLSQADSHLLYLQGQTALAELRAARAKQRMIQRATALKVAEDELKTAEAELKTVRVALQDNDKKQQILLGKKAR